MDVTLSLDFIVKMSVDFTAGKKSLKKITTQSNLKLTVELSQILTVKWPDVTSNCLQKIYLECLMYKFMNNIICKQCTQP